MELSGAEPRRPIPLNPEDRVKIHSAAFYDSLSKISLERRALKEFNRRAKKTLDPLDPKHSSQRVFETKEITQKEEMELKRLARHGGPELSDLRGCRALNHPRVNFDLKSPESTLYSEQQASEEMSSAYNNAFEQHLVNHGIYTGAFRWLDDSYKQPNNLDEIHHRLARRRSSLSLSEFTTAQFDDFQKASVKTITEAGVMSRVLPTIYGNSKIPNEQDLLFTQLASITNATTVRPKPDFYDGSLAHTVHKQVRDDLAPYIIPTLHFFAPIVPNFFLEAKSDMGSARILHRQACYDGALGARGMHKLQSYAQGGNVYDGNAYTFSATYHDGTLKLYSTHLTAPAAIGPDSRPSYRMTQINSFAVTGDIESFCRGAQALRNIRDLAQEYRDKFIALANEKATLAQQQTPAGGMGAPNLANAASLNVTQRSRSKRKRQRHPEERSTELVQPRRQ